MSHIDFKNKVVIVTGAASGIGKNIAAAFGRHGAHVFIVDRDAKKAKAAGAEFRRKGMDVTVLSVDLTRKNAPEDIVKRVIKEAGRIDIVVNNAGLSGKKSLLEESVKSWDASLNVNLRAVFFLSQAAIKAMAKTGGCIVNISSVAANVTCHQSPAYHAAKAGVDQLTRYLAATAGSYGVRVNAVLPGFIVKDEDEKRFTAKNNIRYRKTAEFCHPLGDVGTADDVAEAVLFLSSPQARFITGQHLVVDGGLTLQEQSGLVFRFAGNREK